MEMILIEDCCEILDSKRIPITAKNRTPGPYPYYGANGIQDYVDNYIFDDELVLLAEDGGNFGSTEKPIAYRVSGKCWVNNHAHVLKPRNGIDVDYLCYSLMFYDTNGLVNGATRQKLTQSTLKKMSIPKRTVKQQLQIVQELNTIKKLITARQQELQKLDDLIKARFVEMFESQAWERVRAGTIMLNMRNGVSPSNIGTYPAKVLTLSAITQGGFNPDSWKDGMFDVDPPLEKRVTASDFYMCRGNGNKKLVGVGVYSKEDRYDLIFPDTAIAATIDLHRICLPYLFYAWQQPFVRKQIEAGARTTNGTYKINQGVVSNIELALPPLKLQKQFAAFVAAIDKSKATVQKALDETQLLFDSLMQQYFG